MFGWLNPDEKRDAIKYMTVSVVIIGSIIVAIATLDALAPPPLDEQQRFCEFLKESGFAIDKLEGCE